MPFVRGRRKAHCFREKLNSGERQMMRVIEHLIERIEALIFPARYASADESEGTRD
jgi:hypothetical protein